MKIFTTQKIKTFWRLAFIFLTVFHIIIDSSQAQTSNFFYSFISGDYTFNKRNDDGTNLVTVYTPSTYQINTSAVDGSIAKVYFYETGSNIIFKSDYGGGSRTTAFTTSGIITSMAAGSGYIFYAYLNSPYSVRRCSSTGSGDTQLYLNPSFGNVNCLAFDATNNYLYYYEASYDGANNRIFRTDASGSNMSVIYNNCPSVLSLAAGGGYVYYAINSGTYALYRRTSTGGSETAVYTPPTGSVNKCTYDGTLNKIFFYDSDVSGSKVIYKAAADGGGKTAVYSGFTYVLSSLSSPTAVPIIAPTVTTQAVSSISTTTATGNGNITSLGSPNPTAHGVCWNTSGTPTISDSKNDKGAASATGAYTSSMTSLTAGTLYYVRAFATNTAGTVYGDQVTFTSLKVPTITTQAISGIGTTTATGNGNITDLGVPNPTAHGVCWNTSGTPTTSDSKFDNGAASTTGAFTASMTSLFAGTPYFVRAFATNTAGTVYGDEVTFTTLTNGTWTGTTNTNWSTATNWAGGSVPTSATDVTISSGLTNYPVISATTSADCNNLTVISGGSLTIESSGSGTGSLIVGGTSAGNVTCQRYMTGSKWHLIAPIAEGGSISTFIQAAGNAISSKDVSGTLNFGMMDYNETPNLWNSYFTAATPGNLLAGKGYSLRRTSDGIVTFNGTLTSGTKSVSLTKVGEGWNCVGNPYTSAINMNTAANASNNFLKTNAIDASNLDLSYACLYVWDEAASAYKILGNSSYGVRDLGQNVFQSGQGFFVKANNSGSSVQFTAAMQEHQPTTELKSEQISWPGFELTAASGLIKASTIVTFNTTMTNGLDPTYDAGLLRGSSGISIYTRLVEDNGVDFAIQCLPDNQLKSLIIPLGLDFAKGGEVRFSATATNLPAECNIILEDRTNKTFTLLGNGIEWVGSVNENTKGIGRFFIHTNSLTTGTSSKLSSGTFNLKIFPANGSIWIIGEVGHLAKADLFDVNGRKLGSFDLAEDNRNSISAEKLVPGVYLLKVTSGSRRYTKKVVLFQN